MWKSKKPEEEREVPIIPFVTPKAGPPVSTMEERKPMETAFEPRPTPMKEKIVNIGRSVIIKGELTGNENLNIEGRVEGKIELKDHDLVIGPHAEITAEINAKNVTIEGSVVGNVSGGELVEIKASGSLAGNIESSRICIADGAHFKGSVNLRKAAEAPEKKQTPKPEHAKFDIDRLAVAELQAV